MQNVKTEVKGKQLIITVDLAAETSTSKSGKSEIIATTSGNVVIPGTDITMGLNIYRKK
jgi:hypothetical protein